MYLKLIACNVLFRDICREVAVSPHTFDLDFTEKGSHDNSDSLRLLIQTKIRETEDSGKKYDAILLGYGLCGNSTAGLSSTQFPLVIPRAHDCCTLFLGSKEKFKEYFSANPSRPFSAPGYMERGKSGYYTSETRKFLGLDRSYQEYVELYGEENAQYIIQTLTQGSDKSEDPTVIFIDSPDVSFLGFKEQCKAEAEQEGKEFISIPGDSRLIHKLVFGEWDPEDFVIVPAGKKIVPLYDWDVIIDSGE
jgi:hypothetical protein